MSKKQRVTALEGKIDKSPNTDCIFIFPEGIYEEKYIRDKIIQKAYGDQPLDGLIVILPDNRRESPNKEFNKLMKLVLLEEGREDLVKYIRKE